MNTTRISFAVVSLLNVVLLAVAAVLLSRTIEQGDTIERSRLALAQARDDLNAERARAREQETAAAALKRHLQELTDKLDTASATPDQAVTQPLSPEEEDRKDLQGLFSTLLQLVENPKVEDIERLSQVELQLLESKWDSLPEEAMSARDHPFLCGDHTEIDKVLADPAWNLDGRQLPPEERIELAALLGDLRYFQKTVPSERNLTMIRPEMTRKQMQGDYVTYSGAPPHGPPGAVISAAEIVNPEAVNNRLYFFTEDEHPEMYHSWHVENEQSLKLRVQIYELINGPIEPRSEKSPQD